MKSSVSSPRPASIGLNQDLDTQDLVSKMAQGQTNILVAVRCRPLTKSEKDLNDTKTIHILDSKLIVIIDPFALPNKRSKEKRYAFDFVFSEKVSQQEIFNKTTLSLLDGVLNGFNATVFAYGPTGAGKTYTMMGENSEYGIMLNSFLALFSRIESYSIERKYSVRVSYLEIYNEVVRDLLNPSTVFLDIREDPHKGVVVSDLSELEARRPEEVIDCLKLGNKRRTCEPTEANLTSSRSHAVLQIVLKYEDKSAEEAEILTGKLSLIDLAGSERAANTKNRGIRLIEGANINRSLLALGNCINALYEANSKGIKVYIPYRDSKLTRLLKDSLGGKCRTVMICCVSPYYVYYEDTHNTLEYANRAKNIKTKIERNAVNVDYHVNKYKEIINDLKDEVKQLRLAVSGKKEPVFNDKTNLFLKEIENHFAKESKTKTTGFKLSAEIDGLNEKLLLQEKELNDQILQNSESPAVQVLEEAVEEIRKKLVFKENKLFEIEEEVKGLERKRKEFDLKWMDLPEETLANLRLALQKQVIFLYEIEKEQQKIHEKNKLKYKDLYISILEEKLKLKIGDLELKFKSPTHSEGEDRLYTKNFLDAKNAKPRAFNYRLQGEKIGNKHLKSDSSLPPSSPKYLAPKVIKKKLTDDSSSTSSATEFSQKKPKPKNNSNYPRRRNFGPQSNHLEIDTGKYVELPKVSDRFKNSPYSLWKEEKTKQAGPKIKISGVDLAKLAGG